jgi:hypothetical protein
MKSRICFICLCILLAFASLTGDPASIASETQSRGKLLRVKPLVTFNREQIDRFFTLAGLEELTPARYGIQAYAVTFRSVDLKGKPEAQSGLVAGPDTMIGSRPLAEYFHGTSSRRTDAPSRWSSTDGNATALALASAGFLVCEPDYHGLGSSRGLQSFEQAKPLSDSGIDLLKAAKQLFARQKRSWNGQLFLAGYSEGGYATMAVHRALESMKPAEFTVTASAPGGGPYDVSETTLRAYLETPGENSIAYLAGNLLGYDARYSLFRRTSEVFQTPYDRKVRKLFNGSKTTGEIVRVLPPTAQQLFQPAFLKSIGSDENHPARVALRENDVYDWKPLAPVRFFHAGGDREVPFANAVIARDRMLALGADVELINVGDEFGHSSGAIPSLLGAFAWVKSLAQGL